MTALNFPFYGVCTVQNSGGLPSNCPDGSIAITLDTYAMWVYNITTATWSQISPTGLYAGGNTGAAVTVNFNNGSKQAFTVTAAVTFTLTNPKVGAVYTLELTQASTGGYAYTWPLTVKWPAGSAPSASATGKIDVITLLWDGTSYLGSSSLNN